MTQWDDETPDDAAFARLFATLPAVEPSPAFVQATTEAVWRARTRRRRALWLGAAAAVLLVAGTSVLVAVLGMPRWVLLTAADVMTAALIGLVWVTTASAEAWSLVVRGGAVAARVATMPQSMALLVTAELLGAGALYTLHRLLRSDVRFRRPGPLCI